MTDNKQVELTTICNDPSCKYCKGTGEIEMTDPTTGRRSYCYHFANGTISAGPSREDQSRIGKCSIELAEAQERDATVSEQSGEDGSQKEIKALMKVRDILIEQLREAREEIENIRLSRNEYMAGFERAQEQLSELKSGLWGLECERDFFKLKNEEYLEQLKNLQPQEIVKAAQPFFDWVKKYYPLVDTSDEKAVKLYMAYHNLKSALTESTPQPSEDKEL
jgi:hypothetical protein